MSVGRSADQAAIGLSMACLVHCLAGPFLLIALPSLAFFADSEWVHWVLALSASVLAALIALNTSKAGRRKFVPLALGGVSCLLLGLVAGEAGYDDRLLTLIGAGLLAYAHATRLSAVLR